MSGGAPAWTPASLGASLVAWYRSDQLVTADFSGKVSAWGDLSGNGNAVAQATGASQPTLVAASPFKASLPSVHFISSLCTMWRADFTQGLVAQPRTAIAVVGMTSNGGTQVILDSRANLNRHALYVQATTWGQTCGLAANSGLAVSTAKISRVIGYGDGAASTVRVDTGNPVTLSNATNAMQGITFGGSNSDSSRAVMHAYEFLVISRALTAGELASWQTYAAGRYD